MYCLFNDTDGIDKRNVEQRINEKLVKHFMMGGLCPEVLVTPAPVVKALVSRLQEKLLLGMYRQGGISAFYYSEVGRLYIRVGDKIDDDMVAIPRLVSGSQPN